MKRLPFHAKGAGPGADDALDLRGCVFDQKGFLPLHGYILEAGLLEDGDQAVPADVAREVLLARVREEVLRNFVAEIGAGSAVGTAFQKVCPAIAVIGENKGPLPISCAKFTEEPFRVEGDVQRVAVGALREVPQERLGLRAGFGQVAFAERSLRGDLDSTLPPLPVHDVEPVEGLRVEHLVPKERGACGHRAGVAIATAPHGVKGLRVRKHALAWFCAQFDKVRARRGSRATEKVQQGGADEPSEQGPEGRGSIKVGAGAFAHACGIPRVIADLGGVQGDLGEVPETEKARGSGAVAEVLDDRGVRHREKAGGEDDGSPRMRELVKSGVLCNTEPPMHKRPHHLLFLFLSLLVIVVLGTRVLALNPQWVTWASFEYWRSLLRVGEVMRMANAYYVEPERAGFPAMAETAARSVAESLDRYSEYMDAAEYRRFERETEQRFVGIGVEIERMDRRVTVVRVFPGSGAMAAGLEPGDQFIEIAGDRSEDFSVGDASRRLRGEPDTQVAVKVWRPSLQEALSFTIRRRPVDLPSVEAVHVRGEDGVAYIRLNQFGQKSVVEMRDAVKRVLNGGARGLILDLRDNPGGLLDAAVEVTGIFIPADKPVVSIRGAELEESLILFPKQPPLALTIPLVVLVNADSASASEIVSGALQDYQRAVVVGETTLGKGSVQSIFELSGGAGLRLTTAKYFLPSGRTIAGVGVEPDVRVSLSFADEQGLNFQRSHERRLPKGFKGRFGFEPLSDPQLSAAQDILRAASHFPHGAAKQEAP